MGKVETCLASDLAMSQNQTTRGPQVLLYLSIYQASISGTYF